MIKAITLFVLILAINSTVLAEEEPVATPTDCIVEKCPNEWADCVKDPKCGPTLDECNKKCGTKGSCWSLCLVGKSHAAIEVAKCAQKNHCDQKQEETEEEVYEIGASGRQFLKTAIKFIEGKFHRIVI